jgi:hypothetical protein
VEQFRFEDLFDPAALAEYTPVATIETALRCGWTGSIDRILKVNNIDNKYFDWQAESAGLMLPTKKQRILLPGRTLECDALVAAVAHASGDMQYVGISVYNKSDADPQDIQQNAQKYPKHFALDSSKPGIDRCRAELVHVSGTFLPKPILRSWADEWIRKTFGESTDSHGAYLAVHVRPYPDTCVDAWASAIDGEFNTTLADIHCPFPLGKTLFESLGDALLAAVHKYNASAVFLMSVPSISSVVRGRLLAAGIKHVASFAMEDISSKLGAPSNMHVLLIEQYIARKAAAFVHTQPSSIGVNVGLARLSRDLSSPIETLQSFLSIYGK